jgi:hypothetical protein
MFDYGKMSMLFGTENNNKELAYGSWFDLL